jgi:molybdate transport system ATP-binding protein
MIDVRFRHRFPAIGLDIAFTAPTPGVTALFGPSGSGKTSVVNVIAGLLRPDAGRVAIGGEVLCDTGTGRHLPVERRRLGLVFQEARLFPHLSVENNLRYGLRRAAGSNRPAIGFDDVIDLLGIAPLLGRRPHTLSGGERQRVAIGRALLSQPRLLLMDEPLASLDAERKAEILPYLLRLRAALSLPVVYVTHAMDEVFAIADTLVLLEEGRVRAAGPIATMTARADLPLAARDDAGAAFPVTVAGPVASACSPPGRCACGCRWSRRRWGRCCGRGWRRARSSSPTPCRRRFPCTTSCPAGCAPSPRTRRATPRWSRSTPAASPCSPASPPTPSPTSALRRASRCCR